MSFPGGYSNSDPGCQSFSVYADVFVASDEVAVTVDLYSNAAQTQTTYIIPGPPLYGSASTVSIGPLSYDFPAVR